MTRLRVSLAVLVSRVSNDVDETNSDFAVQNLVPGRANSLCDPSGCLAFTAGRTYSVFQDH